MTLFLLIKYLILPKIGSYFESFVLERDILSPYTSSNLISNGFGPNKILYEMS